VGENNSSLYYAYKDITIDKKASPLVGVFLTMNELVSLPRCQRTIFLAIIHYNKLGRSANRFATKITFHPFQKPHPIFFRKHILTREDTMNVFHITPEN
jgi:hypothetical protein